MQEKKYTLYYQELESEEELPLEDQDLINQAWQSLENAWAPYSGYNVGAAVRLSNGEVVVANNQENVAYPSGLCAERIAMFAAGSSFPGIPMEALAITAKTTKFKLSEPVTPCGACRQVIAEYEERYKHAIRIILSGGGGKVWVFKSISQLLPFLFHAEGLKKQ